MATATRTRNVLMAPVRLIKPSGRVYDYGWNATTTTTRGTAFLAAQTAAASGDIIEVDTDLLLTAAIGKSGIRYRFGAVTITRSNASAGYVISDGGSSMSFSIEGSGIFVRTFVAGSTIAGARQAGVLDIQHASSDVRIECEQIQLTLPSDGPAVDAVAINQTAGRISIRGQRLTCANAKTGLASGQGLTGWWWSNGELNAEFIESVDSSTVANPALGHIYSGVNATPTGDMRIRAERIHCPSPGANSGTAYYGDADGDQDSAAWVDALTIVGAIRPGQEKAYFTSQKITGEVANGFDNKLYVATLKMTGRFHLTDGHSIIKCGQWEPSGTSPSSCINVVGGTHFIEGMEITAATGRDAVVVSAGTLNLLSGKITTDGGRKDFNISAGTCNVWPSVVYDATKLTGTPTLVPAYGTTPTAAGLALFGGADASAQRTSLALVPGTNVQAYNATLASLAGLSEVDKLYYYSSANTFSTVTFPATGGLAFSGGALSAGSAPVNGIVKSNGSGSYSAATAGTDYTAPPLSVITTQEGNDTTVETDLASYTVPAGTLAVNGQSLWFEASGTYAANANTKTIRVKFGAGSVPTIYSTASATNNVSWVMSGRIIRTGALTQKAYAVLAFSNGTTLGQQVTTLDATLANALALRVTGQSATASDDIVLQTFTAGFQ